jgi:hypothetical protein
MPAARHEVCYYDPQRGHVCESVIASSRYEAGKIILNAYPESTLVKITRLPMPHGLTGHGIEALLG